MPHTASGKQLAQGRFICTSFSNGNSLFARVIVRYFLFTALCFRSVITCTYGRTGFQQLLWLGSINIHLYHL